VKSELVRHLSGLEDFESPRISLEQYMTPPQLAGDIIHTAYMNGDIEGRSVVDLGTGTGILAAGAVLAGAETVTAVEKDPDAIEIAERNFESLNIRDGVEIVEEDVTEFSGSFDTVVMNPPFSVHSDTGIEFMKKAVEIADSVYAVSHPGARRQVDKYLRGMDHRVVGAEDYKISLPATYGFHTEDSRETDVQVIVVKSDT
jgi:putative methylase